MKWTPWIVCAVLALPVSLFAGDLSRDLRTGQAQHAFDHLGNIGEQADAAAASGASIIYATGCGGVGYSGLPPQDALATILSDASSYNKHARERGIRIILGYVCATSIVNLGTFDKNWSDAFRARFKTPPSQWRQQDVHGKPLPSWYGGQYAPACMNNPDWQEYEKFIVHRQLECGHDGIFFDNPTVHPQGCYCPFCMKKFSALLAREKLISAEVPVEEARALTVKYPQQFLMMRAGTARDFLRLIRDDARTIRSDALITCNNSLNTPGVLFSQCRTYGYNIFEMSRAEDLVVVEDMQTQPRLLGQRTVEYGPTLRQLHAINHGRPIVANVLAEADNHTPPNLVRLAMAEAAAHDASYLSWPTWPENQRQRMIGIIRPQSDFLRSNQRYLDDTTPRSDILLFLPFRRWTETTRCIPSELAARLTAANLQYRVACEEDLIDAVTPKAPASSAALRTAPGMPVRQVVLVESRSVLKPAEKAALEKFEAAGGLVVAADEADWMQSIQSSLHPSLDLAAPPTVRAVVRDQPDRTIVHLYNLAIERIDSFNDKVHPAEGIALRLRVPFDTVGSVRALSADPDATTGNIPFTLDPSAGPLTVELKLPRLSISTILLVEP